MPVSKLTQEDRDFISRHRVRLLEQVATVSTPTVLEWAQLDADGTYARSSPPATGDMVKRMHEGDDLPRPLSDRFGVCAQCGAACAWTCRICRRCLDADGTDSKPPVKPKRKPKKAKPEDIKAIRDVLKQAREVFVKGGPLRTELNSSTQ